MLNVIDYVDQGNQWAKIQTDSYHVTIHKIFIISQHVRCTRDSELEGNFFLTPHASAVL